MWSRKIIKTHVITGSLKLYCRTNWATFQNYLVIVKTNLKIKLILSNYAIKPGFKNAADIDTSKLAKKAGLASSKSDVVKIDIDKLETTVDLIKLSNVLKNDAVKMAVYDEFKIWCYLDYWY